MTDLNIKIAKTQFHKKEYQFIFEDCESLISGILFLYRLKIPLESSLYKTENDYRLIIAAKRFKSCFLTLREYCIGFSKNRFEAEFTKEHAKLLLKNNVIKVFGSNFK